ncbi:MAG: DUF1275 domain-containing protein [Roseibium sp.]|uniref:YoaK family protein n=1 Tax=Roseibium sp. TaxID=1936156 RepID=UPI002636C18C|nr:YoaK family protein [Roseibium sp.]MCV0427206.1 DUF1275 domain-containing protein [Roseibium sp.]
MHSIYSPRNLKQVFHPDHRLLPVTLAFCACFVELVCIIGLFHTFTAVITGSFVMLFVNMVDRPSYLPVNITVITAYLFMSFVWYALISWLKGRNAVSLRGLFTLEATLVAAFMLFAGLSEPLPGPAAIQTLVSVCLATSAMSLQAAIMTEVLSIHGPTTFMTGKTNRLVAGLFDGWFGGRETFKTHEQARKTAISTGATMAAFAAGGFVGSIAMKLLGFWALSVPFVILLTVALSQTGEHEGTTEARVSR